MQKTFSLVKMQRIPASYKDPTLNKELGKPVIMCAIFIYLGKFGMFSIVVLPGSNRLPLVSSDEGTGSSRIGYS